MGGKTKQCWECHRRRLVCDVTHPECRKCQARGVDCPGYNNLKPVRWVQPQQVNYKRQPLRKGENPKQSGKTAAAQALVPQSLKTSRETNELFEGIEYCEQFVQKTFPSLKPV